MNRELASPGVSTDVTTAAPIVCRPRKPSDLADCVGLLESVFRADAYPAVWPDQPAAWIDPWRTVAAWIACRESSVVGHVAIGAVEPDAQRYYSVATGRPAPELAELKRLFVHPEMRNVGVAHSLHDASLRGVRARDLQPVLETMADNERAIRFYERRGWRRIGTTIANWHMPSGERPLMLLFTL